MFTHAIRLASTFLILAGLGSSLGAGSLTEADKATWIALYEEEVLAHDLYVELGMHHPGIRPFRNIPHSEARHRDAIGAILKEEGLTVPEAPEGRRFVSEDLHALYAKLLTRKDGSPKRRPAWWG